jgi:hypothetical protein
MPPPPPVTPSPPPAPTPTARLADLLPTPVANSPQARATPKVRQPDEPGLEWLPRPQPPNGPVQTEFGVQIAGCEQPVMPALQTARALGVRWIKQQVRWGDMDDGNGRVDWRCLDEVVPTAARMGFRILLSVVTAPAALRIIGTTQGPPDELTKWGEFLSALMTRYAGQVHALEAWNEPNLSAEWDDYIDPIRYQVLLAVAYGVVKYHDPSVMVISAGLAPTAEGGRWAHMDDRAFLARLIEANGLRYADCVGAHANGPPGEGELPAVLARYAELLAREALPDERRPLCFTEFGYSVPVQGRTPEGFAWAMGHTPQGQAEAIVRYMRAARESGQVKLAIIFNLNYDDGVTPNSIAALVRQDYTSPALVAIARELGRHP